MFPAAVIETSKLGTLIDRSYRVLTSTNHAWRSDSSTKNKEPGTKNSTIQYPVRIPDLEGNGFAETVQIEIEACKDADGEIFLDQ